MTTAVRWETLPLEFDLINGHPEIRCIAAPDCHWRWPLDCDALEATGMNTRNALEHVRHRHGGLRLSSAPTETPRPLMTTTRTEVRP